MSLDKKVDEYIDYGYDVLKKLIACESVLDEYRENSDIPFGEGAKKALLTLLEVGNQAGFKTKNVDNYAGYLEFGTGKDVLGVLAHLDVVPVAKEEWETNPFELVFKGDKMYGRGTTDDKGPLVASLVAMKMLLDEGFKPNYRVRLIAGCDEESGSRCLERYLEKEGEPAVAFSPDASFPVIYGEKAIISYDLNLDLKDDCLLNMEAGLRYNMVPSDAKMTLSVDLKDKYLAYLKENGYEGKVEGNTYYAKGKISHAMEPDNGLNAIYILFDFLAKNTDSKAAKFIEKYYLWDNHGKKAGYYDEDLEMHDLTSNMAIARTENGKLRLGVNCRCPLDSAFETIPAALKKITDGTNNEFNFLGGSPRHYVPKNSKLVSTLVKVYRDVTGDMSEPITIGGGTYAREMINAVAFGPIKPNEPDVCHISNEYFTVQDFKDAIKIYYLAIKELSI